MNIVFGGSFNPVTIAHEKIVNLILSKFPDAKVIILPVGNSYNKPKLVSFNDRMTMLNLVFKDNERVILSELEKEKVFDGTINSLDELKMTYGDLYFVMGTDNLKGLKHWIEYERLIKTYPFILIERDKDLISELIKDHPLINPNYLEISFDENVSSTIIRTNVDKYKSYLKEDVYKYIKANKLYEVGKNV